MLTKVKDSYEHSGISHMIHLNFIICSKINREGSKSGSTTLAGAGPDSSVVPTEGEELKTPPD